MGQQIIRQPDGKFAIFSSVTDTIIVWDSTGPEVIEWFADQAAQEARVNAARILGHVAGGRPGEVYAQFALAWHEAIDMDRDNGGQVWQSFQDEG